MKAKEELLNLLQDEQAMLVSILRGTMKKLSPSSIGFLYSKEELLEAMKLRLAKDADQ